MYFHCGFSIPLLQSYILYSIVPVRAMEISKIYTKKKSNFISKSLYMLSVIDGSARSIDRAIDASVVSATIDRATIDRSRCAIDGWLCTIHHPWPSIDACTVTRG